MTAGIAFRAYGRPIPQGSKTLVPATKGRPAFLRDSNASRLKPWRERIRAAAEDAVRYTERLEGPVFVRVTFSLDRPKSHYRTGRHAHVLRDDAPRWPCAGGSGDLDKLVRAALDACTDAKVWADDVQVVDVRARRVWVNEHELALPKPGVLIHVIPLDQAEVLV